MPLPAKRSRLGLAAASILLTGGVAVGWSQVASAEPPEDRAEQFNEAAEEFGVPEKVLLGVSYMESRWQDHGGEYSTGGGFGPMHLTDSAHVAKAENDDGHHSSEDPRGDPSRPLEVSESGAADADEPGYKTLPEAAKLTGASADQLRTDAYENIRGGAALLESYAEDLDVSGDDPANWYTVVARYSQAAESEAAKRFADNVYSLIDSGAKESTDAGNVVLEAEAVKPERDMKALGLKDAKAGKTECPAKLACEAIPAPYEQYGEEATDYGNHDKAKRPDNGLDIDQIVIHDTETSYTNAVDMVQDPEYISWQYTLRSFDGHVAQHVKSKDVAWQAGNWHVNSHSVGLEHEGVAAEGSWFTEEMYRSSAALVKYLSKKHDVPLDREHIIGHDNVPAPDAESAADMHWDPGPFWDWQHYFDLMGAPVEDSKGDLVRVAPEYADHAQEFVGCDSSNPEASCGERSASTVFLRSKPKADAPLLKGADGEPATNKVNDVGSRAGYGQAYAVAEEKGEWTAVWYQGQKGWIHNPKDNPTLIPADGATVSPKSDDTKVYGLPYPEKAAYKGTDVPPQDLSPLPYTLDKGQAYSAAGKVDSQYFHAKEYEVPGTVVNGDRTYYQVQVGSRVMYVDASDVKVTG